MEGRTAYLFHLLVWSLPVLALQGAALVYFHRRRAGAILRAVLPPAFAATAWLTLADHLAISSGVWRFGEGKHLGIRLGSVPIEEAIFFLITNLLVALGLALFSHLGARRAA